MDNQNNFSLNSLKWVKQEIDASLQRARENIQRYASEGQQKQHLDEALRSLTDALGTLDIAELSGGALLAREIREVLQALQDGRIRDVIQASRPVVRALIQLSDYLDYIESGNPDVPIVLVNVINDLRGVRHVDLLSDEIVDIPGLDNDEAVLSRQSRSNESISSLAGVARHVFELGLLGWYRNRNVEASLKKMGIVCRRLKGASTHLESRRLWWVSEAVISGLRSKTLPASHALKSLVGKIDRQIKQLQAMGDREFAAAVPLPLVKSLLYYVATAHPGDKVVDEVREAYFLKEGGVTGDVLSAAQISIGGQNSELYRSLSRALQEKLTEAKDLLEVHVHAEQPSVGQLQPVLPLLKELAGTLSMLGMRHQESHVAEHAARVKGWIDAGERPAEDAVSQLADMLVGVETAVQAFSMLGRNFILSAESANREESADQVEGMIADEEFRNIRTTVIHESQQNLERCKAAIQAYAANPNVLSSLESVPGILGQISGAMLLVSLEDVAGLLEGVSQFVQSRKAASRVISHEELEHIAEAVSAVDVYLEILDTSGIQQDQYLEKGAQAVALLDENAVVAEADPTGMLEPIASPEDTASLFNPETLVFDLNVPDEGGGEAAAGTEKAPPPQKSFEVSIVKDADAAPAQQAEIRTPAANELDSLVYGEESFDDVAAESAGDSMLLDAATLTIAGLAGDEQLDVLDEDIAELEQDGAPLPSFADESDRAANDEDPFAASAFMTDDLDAVVSELESEEGLVAVDDGLEGNTDEMLLAADALQDVVASSEAESEPASASSDEEVTQIYIDPVSLEAEELAFASMEDNEPGSTEAEDRAATEVVDVSGMALPVDETLSGLEIDSDRGPEVSAATLMVEGLTNASAVSGVASDIEEAEALSATGEKSSLEPETLTLSGIDVEEFLPSDDGQEPDLSPADSLDAEAGGDRTMVVEAAPDATGLDDTLASLEINEGLEAEAFAEPGVESMTSSAVNEAEPAVAEQPEAGSDGATRIIGELPVEAELVEEFGEESQQFEETEIAAADASMVDEVIPLEEVSPIQDLMGDTDDLLGQTGVQKLDLDSIDETEAPDLSIVETSENEALTLVDILPEDEVFSFSGMEEGAEPVAEAEESAAAVEHDQAMTATLAGLALPAAFAGLSVMKPGADEEIFDIFLEEFAEESAVLHKHYPQWKEQPSDRDVLLTLRRSFHTLKGSARLVGAEIAGEYAWLHEDILNQVLENSREITPEIVSCIGDGIELLPRLLEQLQSKEAPDAKVIEHCQRADQVARGEAVEEKSVAPDEAVVESPDTLISAYEDPVLMQIFIEEAHANLATLDSTLQQLKDGTDAAVVKDELFRSIHTLTGSARTAKVPAIHEPCAAFEHYLGLRLQQPSTLSEMDMSLLQRLSEHVAATIDALQEGTEASTAPDLIVAVEQMSEELADAVDNPEVGYTQVIDEEEVAGAIDAVPEVQAPEQQVDVAQLPEVSDELVQVFLGECEEILERCDDAMQRWKQNPDDMGFVRELHRELHTLKGSARMAGLQPIGDLSHAMETLLTAVDAGTVTVDKTLFKVVFGAFDRFGEMNESIRTGKPIAPADAVIELMGRLQEGQTLDERDLGVLRFGVAEAEAEPLAVEVSEAVQPEVTVGEEFESHLAAMMPHQAGEGIGGELLVSRLQDSVKVNPELLDQFVDSVGEINILHSRVEQQMTAFGFNLNELDRTVSRLTEQLRRLEMEAEAQILHRFDGKNIDPDATGINEQFDPLELDRYSTIQQLSRSLAESTNDLLSIHQLLSEERRDVENLLQQESRVSNSLQESLMRTRMSPFKVMAPRLRRVVRGVALELGKEADLQIEGEEQELDRKVLEGIVVPLEHLLRNALAHGIETPAEREAAGKPAAGSVAVKVSREGPEVIIEVVDDGAGINRQAVRQRAIEMGIIEADSILTDAETYALVLHPGFSTATEISQVSGRGVGMDVVQEQLKHLNGLLEIFSEEGKGTRFKISLPFTMAINQSLLVKAGDNTYAVPINTVEAVIQMPANTLLERLDSESPMIDYGERSYSLYRLDEVLENTTLEPFPAVAETRPVLLVGSGEHRVALIVDDIKGNQDVVVKPIGGLLNSVPGLGGATILGDGQVVLILDTAGVVRAATGDRETAEILPSQMVPRQEARPTIMVVDDSITIRRVTEKMLERHHFNVVTAKDGLDAVAQLEEVHPDMMLLDIEMPRMDGFELAAHMQSSELNQDIPIIMISSRTGKKHRERAEGLGIKEFLGKPYQDSELLQNIEALLSKEKVGSQHVN
jgi:chemosensory pili system protein ChpA (sensor histidine kinase/response regulator)